MSLFSEGTEYNKPERFEWLMSIFEKRFDNQEQAFQSLNQKATWVLATATSLIAASGFIKGDAISKATTNYFEYVFSTSAPSQNIIFSTFVVILAVVFAIMYFFLLVFVTRVYSPKYVEYPISPINEELGQVKSHRDDKGDFGSKCWEDVMDRYVLSENYKCYHIVLRGYVDAHIEMKIVIDKMGRDLKQAFTILTLLGFVSVMLLFAA